VKRLFVHGAEKSNAWIDISADIQAKVDALRKHASQLGDWDPEQMIREWAADEGKDQGLALAEAYKVMLLVKDEEQA
jgi:LmbE family N-acetylglucosaminyl deacetylase